jgi:BirA family transcriptional regulator, biotin operon repressor / biotin---[acetyl-CoA-carboxylase] ligase
VPPGYSLIWLDDIDSTNLEALRRAEKGLSEPTWIVAKRQTEGRGRRGRTWITSPGNLFATLLLQVPMPARVLAGLSFVAAVAVAHMLKQLVEKSSRQVDVRLKWPNDILLNNAKAGGILIETTGSGSRQGVNAVAIGIGLNVSSCPGEALAYPTTDFSRHGLNLSRDEVFEQLAISFDHHLDLWQNGAGFASIRQRWLEFGPSVGQDLKIDSGGDVVTGVFAGLDQHGELQLQLPDGSQRLIVAGDVVANDPNSPIKDTG